MPRSVTPADTARHLRQRALSAEALGAERARHLRARLPAAVRCLRERHGAEAVILFGSLAAGTCRADSDLDLATSGLSAHRYFKALADLMEVFEGPVDLVRLEEAPESLRERIAAEGEPL
ncbi:MAG: nucleotidyltransferase domain-containing protein [Chromatiaceae bacterium]|jgi:predicted nucleotidyltransferase|nr:nucleotidyltransferase domain-containing protein [Chromatiaceae bacterium]